MGAGGDGKSLQSIDGVWVAALPTAGVVNDAGGATPSGEVVATEEEDSVVPKNPFTVELPKNAVARVSSSFVPTSDLDRTGMIVWNFGDGTPAHTAEFGKVEHTYAFPGEYVVMAEHYLLSSLPFQPENVLRTVISVKEEEIEIGIHESGLYYELVNNSVNEVSLEGWSVRQHAQVGTFARNTVLLPNGKIVLWNYGFRANGGLELLFPNGELAGITN